MRTSKPISTISYNTENFLKDRLNELVRKRTISDWAYIKHWAEETEKKEHIHLYMNPNRMIDTVDMQIFLSEPVFINGVCKPLKCIDFRRCNIDDWILYTEHYEPYIISKNEEKEFCYSKDDFVFYDEDNFDELYNHAHFGSEWAHRNKQIEMIRECGDPSMLIMSGSIPLNLATNLSALHKMLVKGQR